MAFYYENPEELLRVLDAVYACRAERDLDRITIPLHIHDNEILAKERDALRSELSRFRSGEAT